LIVVVEKIWPSTVSIVFIRKFLTFKIIIAIIVSRGWFRKIGIKTTKFIRLATLITIKIHGRMITDHWLIAKRRFRNGTIVRFPKFLSRIIEAFKTNIANWRTIAIENGSPVKILGRRWSITIQIELSTRIISIPTTRIVIPAKNIIITGTSEHNIVIT